MREWKDLYPRLGSTLTVNNNQIKSLSVDGQYINRLLDFTGVPDFHLTTQDVSITPFLGGYQFSVAATEDHSTKMASLMLFLLWSKIIILTKGTEAKRVCQYIEFGESFKLLQQSSFLDVNNPEKEGLQMTIAFSYPDSIVFDTHFPTAAVTYLRLEI